MTAQDPYSSFVPDLRPAYYADHLDVVSAILSGIKGEQRRRNLQGTLQEGGEVATAALVPLLAADVRGHLANHDPRWLGGELLPPDLPGETTIARICFNTITWHVIEIRALQGDGLYTYRIVDDLGTRFIPAPDVSRRPLSFIGLVRLIDGSHGVTGDQGLVIPVLRQQFPALRSHFDPRWGETAGDRSALIDSVRAFVTVTSELYPELEDYYRTRVDEVLATLGYLRGFCRPIQHTIGTEHPRFGGTPAHDDAIERLMRAWARSQEPVTCLAAGMARNSRRKALEKYLHEYALLHGKLPAGEVRPIEHLDSWTIDIDDLTETGELVERLLTEGRAPVDTDPAWLAGAADHLSILEFGQRYYVVHEDELEGPFVVADLEDYLRELVYDNGELIARLSWDGGAPGSSGCVSAYRLFGKLFITNEMGLNGPFDDFCDAARRFGLYWINDATTEIWDAEHGTVFENGVLYRPDVVERYGKISIDMEYEAGHGPTEEASAS